MAIAFDDKLLGRAHGAHLCHPAHVVAAQIQQHQMLGQFLLIGQQIKFQRLVFVRRGPAHTGACDGAHGHFAVAQADQNFGRCADDLEAAKVEKEHERRGVGTAQRAIQRKGRQFKALRPALAGDHLKNIACADIVFGALYRRDIAVMGKIRHRITDACGLSQIAGDCGGAVKITQRVHHPFCGLRISGTRRQTRRVPCRRHKCHFAFNPVQHRHNGRAQQHGIGQAQRIGVYVGQMFHQPDHIIAKIAEQAAGNRGHAFGQINPRFRNQGAQAGQGGGRFGHKSGGIKPRLTVH